MKNLVVINEEVRQVLNEGGPVVALESTILAHGMPFPENIETALAAESLVRKLGVTPATVGIIDGTMRIGLSKHEIERLGSEKGVFKTSRRDLSYVVARGLSGATTVCGTLIAAHMAGIRVFATGGIGGVHWQAEHSFDVSADLMELARTPLIVVSAGAKAILDLPKTLEFLETHGVPVLGFQTDEFPAFYSRLSGIKLEHRVDTAAEICRIYTAHRSLQLTSSLLVVNPVPSEYELPRELVAAYLERALAAMGKLQLTGSEVTPFLLAKIVEFSDGEALKTNIALLNNNVSLASQIALGLVSQE